MNYDSSSSPGHYNQYPGQTGLLILFCSSYVLKIILVDDDCQGNVVINKCSCSCSDNPWLQWDLRCEERSWLHDPIDIDINSSLSLVSLRNSPVQETSDKSMLTTLIFHCLPWLWPLTVIINKTKYPQLLHVFRQLSWVSGVRCFYAGH